LPSIIVYFKVLYFRVYYSTLKVKVFLLCEKKCALKVRRGKYETLVGSFFFEATLASLSKMKFWKVSWFPKFLIFDTIYLKEKIPQGLGQA